MDIGQHDSALFHSLIYLKNAEKIDSIFRTSSVFSQATQRRSTEMFSCCSPILPVSPGQLCDPELGAQPLCSRRSSENFQGDLSQAEGEGILPTPGETEGHHSPRRARRPSPECGHPRDVSAPPDPEARARRPDPR
ncbi:lymphocyte antigen 6H isoform 1-T3 [Callospermophilus lateralis]|uniref:uncharacterized protein LOC143382219 isoform X1 n=1 Tax=Callospermophilus lateralis TaxID=76772 RepID=UPI0040542544